MEEIEIKDYESARETASRIHGIGDNIMEIFNEIDSAMNDLYGETWQSSGADASHGRYRELKSNYDLFYQKIIEMHNHINNVTNRDQATDREAIPQQ